MNFLQPTTYGCRSCGKGRRSLFSKTTTVFLIFGMLHISCEAEFPTTSLPVPGGRCFITNQDPFDAEKENDVNVISDRAYPLLNCTAFNLVFFKEYQFNQSIRGFLLQKSKTTEFDIYDLNVFPDLKTVEFRDCPQIHFSLENSTRTPLKNITSLSVSRCGLNNISSGLLRSFPNIIRLTLARNNISQIRGEEFLVCKKLQSINLGHNPLDEDFNATWLHLAPTLHRLSLRATNLKKIDEVFKGATYLDFLDLSDNAIEKVPMKAFRQASNLSTLILANNRINNIHHKSFKGAINLRFIDLTENKIQTLPEGVFDFSPLDELTVELWENFVTCDCHLKWLKVWLIALSDRGIYPDIRLKCHNPARNHGKKLIAPNGGYVSPIDLSCREDDKPWNGHIGENSAKRIASSSTSSKSIAAVIPSKQLENISCPDSCSCYANKQNFQKRVEEEHDFPLAMCLNSNYHSMPADLPSGVRAVVMTSSKWTRVDLSKINLPHLTKLALAKNRISTLLPSSKKIFENVVILHLEHNFITEIKREFLESFPNLRILKLYDNQIIHFADDLFFYNRKIKKLFLGPNPLQKSFNGKCLDDLPLLNTVSLRGIKLREIPSSLKNKIALSRVDLSDNMLRVVPPDAFLNCTTLVKISLENNNISAIDEAAFRNVSTLTSIDLSENALASVSPEIFLSVSHDLSHIELWQNPLHCNCLLQPFIKWVKQMENDNPLTEIRFRCEQPSSMAGKTSDETAVEDYVCSESNQVSAATRTGQTYTENDVIAAALGSIFGCILLALLIKFARVLWNKDNRGTNESFLRRQYSKISSLSSSPSDQRNSIVDEEANVDVML